MSSKNIYGRLGLLDFLAYYIPGAVVVVTAIATNKIMGIGFPDVTSSLKSPEELISTIGFAWAAYAILIPYLTGHVIFPVGYLLSYLLRRVPWPRWQIPNTLSCHCPQDKPYCAVEDPHFARCLLDATNKSAGTFDDLMITRFRALSRFSRSMLFPSILLVALGIYLLIGSSGTDTKESLILMVIGLGSAVGFWYRHRNYEVRWRNGICVAAHPEMGRIVRLIHP